MASVNLFRRSCYTFRKASFVARLANGLRPQFYSTQAPDNNAIEPAPPQETAPQGDHFSEMMSDRTNALLQSLGVDIAKLQESTMRPQAAEHAESAEESSQGPNAVPEAKAAKPKAFQRSYFFDTQDVYTELRSAGLTPGQAEAIMRTIQDLMQELVKLCKDRSVPVSAAANEAYLFDAASSEVRNEISNSRQIQSTTYRSGLARLQRDVEILQHEANEMTSLLKSDLDIEVHERKNATRAEENVIHLKIQDLHNKISTRLNSELKSEIENLRWQITRRSLAAIAIIAATFIWLTQTNNRTKTAKSQERQRQLTGVSVPVPVLAPSMSSNEESEEHSTAPILVEELPDYTHEDNEQLQQAGPATTVSNSAHSESEV